MKTASVLLLLAVFFISCRKNADPETIPDPEYVVEETPYGQFLRLPTDTSLRGWTGTQACRSWEFHDRDGKKKSGFVTGSIFYLGFFPNVTPEERVRILKKWGLFGRTQGDWLQTYNPARYNQCYMVHAPDSLTTCEQQADFMKRLQNEPTIKFANPFLMYQPVSSYVDRIIDELVGEASADLSEGQLAEILSGYNINFIRRQAGNQIVYTLIVPKGERNALDWATFLIEKGYFRILYPPSFDDGRPAGQ